MRSEHGSPHLSVSPDGGRHGRGGALPPLDLSFSNFDPAASAAQPSSAPYDVSGWTGGALDPYFCTTPDSDRPIFSAGLEPPSVDWSAFDLPLGGGGSAFASPSHAPRPSYGSFDLHGTAYASSTAASDNGPDDLCGAGGLGVPSPLHPPSLVFQHFPSDTSDACDSDFHRLSAASSLHGLPQLSLLASGNLDSMGIDDFLSGAGAGPASPLSPTDAVSDAGSVTFVGGAAGYAPSLQHNEPTKLAPTSMPAHEKRYSLPLTGDGLHPLWGAGALEPTAPVPHGSSPIALDPDHGGPEILWAT